jgi:P-type conjugative transfer protein TrbJ
MKRSSCFAAALLLSASLAPSPPASAQFFGGIVYDPTNYAQNVLSASRALIQINNQIKQLANEILMLENMAKDLAALPHSIAAQLKAKLAAVDSLITTAQGLAYQVAAVKAQYDTLFPKDYGAAPPATGVMLANALKQWEQSRQGYSHALEIQAEIVGNVRKDIAELDTLIGDSQSAVGNLQVLQAGNQISALAAQQMLQIESLLVAQYRAEALEQSRRLSEREFGRARFVRFLGDRDAYSRN